MLADINVSLPLGSIDRELIRLAEDSGARVPWTVIVRLCGSMESIETMEDVLEMSGEMMLSLPPQETMRLAIRRITVTRAPRASISMVHASRGRDISASGAKGTHCNSYYRDSKFKSTLQCKQRIRL